MTDAPPLQFCPRCATALPLGFVAAPGFDAAYAVCGRCGAALEMGAADGPPRALAAMEIQGLPEPIRAGVLGAMAAVVGQRRPMSRERGDG